MPEFNGENLLITLDPVVDGVLGVDVGADMYAAWKTWVKQGNMRYPPAFRTTGGDELTEIIDAGAYFFLRNDYGWRVKPYENDGTYYMVGNLAVQDTSLPALVPTDGGYTAAILGLQPVTQGVTASMGNQLEQISFEGLVTLDIINGETGTGLSAGGTPIGSGKTPSNNIIDTITIGSDKGFDTIHVNDDITFDATTVLDSLIIEGDNSSQSTFTFLLGASTGDTSFRAACLVGALSGALFVEGCALVNLSGVGCTTSISRFINCAFEGGYVRIRGDNNKEVHFVSCENAALDAELDINSSIADIRLQQFSGDLLLTNLTTGNTVVFNTTGGHLYIDASCTNGTVILQGDSKYTNDGEVTIIDETSAKLANAHLERSIWVDTEQVAAGDGSQSSPFNTLTASIDTAEAEGIKTLKVYADIILDRQVKNFNIDGVGQPTVDCNGKTLTKSQFWYCNMEGVSVGAITVQQGVLLAGFEFSGFAEKCAFGGDVTITGPTHIMECYSNAPGAAYINIITGANILQVSDWHRSLGVKGMTAGTHTVEMYGGQFHLDDTCTGGIIYLRGNYSLPPDDQSAGTTIIDQTENAETWTHVVEGSYTAEEIMRLMASALAGKVSGAETDTIRFRDLADSKDRIVATVDTNANRTNVVKDVT